MEIHVKNQTDKTLDLCCGLDQELTVEPGEDVAVRVEDGDIFYIDQIGDDKGDMNSLLGKKARDKITGFAGTITGRCEYLYGCTQYCIVPPAKDGDYKESQWFDEGRIEFLGDGIRPEEVTGERPGGPNIDCPMAR